MKTKATLNKLKNKLSKKEMDIISRSYNKYETQESLNDWFDNLFIFNKKIFSGLSISLFIVFICIILSNESFNLVYSILSLCSIYILMSLVLSIYECISNDIPIYLFVKIKYFILFSHFH